MASETDDRRAGEVVNVLATGLIAADLAIASSAATGSVMVIAAAGAVAPIALQKLLGFGLRSRRREVEAWYAQLMAGDGDDGVTAEEIAAKIESRCDDPVVAENVLQTARALQERLDPIVLPALSVLSREYIVRSARPDGFFRGVHRILIDLDETRFSQLQRLCASAAACAKKSPIDTVQMRIGGPVAPDCAAAVAMISVEKQADEPFEVITMVPQALTLMRLLARETLAADTAVFGGGARIGTVELVGDIARRLSRILGVHGAVSGATGSAGG